MADRIDVVVADSMTDQIFGTGWSANGTYHYRVLTAVRDLFTPEALAQAAAKIVTGGEEGSGVVPHGSAAPCTDPSGDTAAAKVQEAES